MTFPIRSKYLNYIGFHKDPKINVQNIIPYNIVNFQLFILTYLIIVGVLFPKNDPCLFF